MYSDKSYEVKRGHQFNDRANYSLLSHHKLKFLFRSVVPQGIKHIRISGIACSELGMRNSLLRLRLYVDIDIESSM